MAVEDYEELACECLGLHHPAKGSPAGVRVGKFTIAGNPDTYNALAFRRQEYVSEVIFNDPEFFNLMSEEDQHNLRIAQAPASFDLFLELAESMPAFLRDYSKHDAEFKAYRTALDEIEQMMEKCHPGITLDRSSNSYNSLSARMADEYKHMTGKNVYLLAERAQKSKGQLLQKYNDTQILFYRECWEAGRYPANASGYFQYVVNDFPKYGEMFTREIGLSVPNEARKRHTYVVGGTGSGKSELLKLLVRGDIENDDSAVVVVDPHGDLVEQISQLHFFDGSYYAERLVYIDPFLIPDQTPVINPLDCPDTTAHEREVIADQLTSAFEELLKGDGGSSLSLNMRTLIKPCLLVLLDRGDCTLSDLQVFLNDERNGDWVKLALQSERRSIRTFFENEFSNSSFGQTKESLRNKLQSLFNSSALFDMVNGPSTIDLKQAIEERKIILFNLPKGRVGNDASDALGRFVIAMLKGIAMRRAEQTEHERVPVHLYIDECQNYIGPSIHTILTETRKYKLYLTMAQQVAGDGMSTRLKDVVFNNVQVNFAGRTKRDSNLPKILNIDIEDLQQLDTGRFYCQVGNGPAISMQAINTSELAAQSFTKEKLIKLQAPYYATSQADALDNEEQIQRNKPYQADLV